MGSNDCIWDSLIKLINSHSDDNVRKKSNILLKQYNTAGGIKIKDEILNFIHTNNIN
jgi:hypothetical protein